MSKITKIFLLSFIILISALSCNWYKTKRFSIIDDSFSIFSKYIDTSLEIYIDGNFKILYEDLGATWNKEGDLIHGRGMDSQISFYNESDSSFKIIEISCSQIYKGSDLTIDKRYPDWKSEKLEFPLLIESVKEENNRVHKHIQFPLSKTMDDFAIGDTIKVNFKIRIIVNAKSEIIIERDLKKVCRIERGFYTP